MNDLPAAKMDITSKQGGIDDISVFRFKSQCKVFFDQHNIVHQYFTISEM